MPAAAEGVRRPTTAGAKGLDRKALGKSMRPWVELRPLPLIPAVSEGAGGQRAMATGGRGRQALRTSARPWVGPHRSPPRPLALGVVRRQTAASSPGETGGWSDLAFPTTLGWARGSGLSGHQRRSGPWGTDGWSDLAPPTTPRWAWGSGLGGHRWRGGPGGTDRWSDLAPSTRTVRPQAPDRRPRWPKPRPRDRLQEYGGQARFCTFGCGTGVEAAE